MTGRTWYHREGSKSAELWTILHLPYTFMAISFLVVGFGIQKPVNWEVLGAAVVAYFLGLGSLPIAWISFLEWGPDT